MKIYTTKGGEQLDDICFSHYGDEQMITEVYRYNKGIEALPLQLPAGLAISLPEKKEEVKQGVRLW